MKHTTVAKGNSFSSIFS